MYAGQSLPHDGDWLESKQGVPVSTHRGRWLAGENFLWYCTMCHAQVLGIGAGSLSLHLTRTTLGITRHAEIRRERVARVRRQGNYSKAPDDR